MMAEDNIEDEDREGVEGEDGEGEEEGKKKGGFPKLLLIILPVLLIAIGGGLYFTGFLDSVLGKDTASAEGEEHAEEDDHGDGHGDGHGGAAGNFVEVPPILVNLIGSSGETHYLKLQVKLEVEKASDVLKIEAVLPRVIDRFQTYLREMRIQDLRGSAGIYRLRQELLYRVNKAAAPVVVKDILFQEMLIQ